MQNEKKRIALLVSSYAPDLRGGINDLGSVSTYLMDESIGDCSKSHSKWLPNCQSKYQFSKWIEDNLETWKVHDQLIFYYTGHGIMRREKFFFEFWDDNNKMTHLLFDNFINELIHGYGVSNCIFIIDACHSGALTNLEASKSRLKGLELNVKFPEGIAYISSSSSEFQRSYENQKHKISVFTELFSNGLKTGLNGKKTDDGLITIDDMVSYINSELKKEPYRSYKQEAKGKVGNFTERFWIAKNISGSTEEYPDDFSGNSHIIPGIISKLYDDLPFMKRPCQGGNSEDLDWDLISRFYQNKRGITIGSLEKETVLNNLNFFSNMSHGANIKFLRNDVVICFHNNPSDFFPCLRTRVIIPNKPAATIDGPISRQISKILDLIDQNSFFSLLDHEGRRQESSFIGSDAFEVIREILSNAFAHRDYSDKGYINVKIYNDNIEITNPGELYTSWETLLEDSVSGNISKPVNDTINDFLLFLEHYEGKGRGFLMMRDYKQKYGKESITYKRTVNESISIKVRINQSDRAKHQSQNKFLTRVPSIDQIRELIGRDADMQGLKEMMDNSSNAVLVNGLGGIGKTTLVTAYIQKYEKDYDHLVWINYNEDLISSIALNEDLVVTLDVPFEPKEDLEERFRRILHELNRLSGRNLLVIDNVQAQLSQQEIFNLLPSRPTWQILVTSRQKLSGFDQFLLNPLTPETARKLFQTYYAGSFEEDELETLLKETGYHTLTIELLAKLLDKLNNILSLSELTDLFRKKQLNDPDLQEKVWARYSGEERSLYLHLIKTFELTLLTDSEKWLLKQFIVLPLEHYSVTKLADLLKKKPLELNKTLNSLASNGWLVLNKDKTFSIHRLVQQVVEYQLYPTTLADVEMLVDTIIQKTKKDAYSDPVKTNSLWINYATKVEQFISQEKDERIVKLQNNIAQLFLTMGQYEKALEYQKKALDIITSIPGIQSSDLAIYHNNIAAIFYSLGKYKEALTYYNKTLSIREKTLSSHHPDLAVSYNNLAAVYKDLRQYDEALSYHKKALSIREKILEAQDPDLAVSYNNIATVYLAKDHNQQALEYYEKALNIWEAVLDAQHPDLAISYNNIAEVYLLDKQNKQALECYEKALKIRKAALDANHPDLANSYQNIAEANRALGEYTKALKFHKKALSINEKILNTDNPSLATSYHNIAETLFALGNYDEALQFHQKALAIRETALDTNHPDLINSYISIADIYSVLEDEHKALQYFRKARPED